VAPTCGEGTSEIHRPGCGVDARDRPILATGSLRPGDEIADRAPMDSGCPNGRRNSASVDGVGPAMVNKMMLKPGPKHPITVEPAGVRVIVRVAGQVIADSSSVLTVREADYPAVHYFPREDVDLSALERTSHESYCPFKGDASYFSIPRAGERGINAVWAYEAPYEAVANTKDHMAFYTNRMDSVQELPL